MTGQKDNPDDLIAELTKLMAADPRKETTRDTPSASTPPEVRIPGGQPSIRIPGVPQPVATNPQPGPGKFDFGQPARPASAPTPEPRADWQERLGGRARPEADPLASFDLPSTNRTPSSWRPAIGPGEADAPPAAPPSGFDFDFGFNRERPSQQQKPAAQAPAPRPAPAAFSPASAPTGFTPGPTSYTQPAQANFAQAPAPVRANAPLAPAVDPIAELIAAELGAQMQANPSVALAPQPAPLPAAPPLNFAPLNAPQPVQPAPAPQPVQMQAAPAPQPVQPQAMPVPVAAPIEQAPPQRVAAPRQPAENDRFSTAPVFGLSNRVTGEMPAPKVELDPMDEIENLIGEAVRVELNMPQPTVAPLPVPAARAPQPQATPTVPPLGTQFAPRRTTSLRESDFGDSADEAILAAAAAGGAEVSRVDSPFADERSSRQGKQKKVKPEKPPRQERQRADVYDRPQSNAFKQLVVPAIAGTILLAGGFGLYWALGMSHNGGKAPVLTADATPTKTIPPKPADSVPHSAVMDQLSGTAPPASTETLVSRDQTAGADATQVAAASAPPTPAASGSSTANASDSGLANRKVRTVTVRPDGSIVTGEDTVAGSAQLPVSRPNVPTVPGAAAANTDAPAPATSDTASADTSAAATAVAAPSPTSVASTQSPTLSMPGNAAADSAGAAPAVGTPDPNAPIPLPPPDRSARSAGAAAGATSTPTSPVNAVIKSNNPGNAQPVDLIGDLAAGNDQTTAPAAASPTQTQVATAAASGGGHVQLSSQTSAAGADASANSLMKRFGNLWGGGRPQVVKADLGAKGVYYRVEVMTNTAADATALCSAIKSSGGDCVANR